MYLLKIYPNEGLCGKQMTDEELTAVIKVAHAAGKKVCAHLSSDKAIMESVQLGVDCMEHGYTLSEETAERMAKHSTYFVPTLREMEFLAECDMSKLGIIKAATSTSAELCGLQNVTGTLKAGMMDDFIVV